ncbi:hypothetical protein F4677DRAFT_436698 [Hypoxylon crocopeplum]|nr:hypothetical protein F4677DRAFT_436698 [Hypoxylon crocopeplum]
MPPRKRAAADAAVATPETGGSSRRRSGRLSSSGRKSTYFEDDDSDRGEKLSRARPRKVAKTESKTPRRISKAKSESEDELQHEDDNDDDDDDDNAFEDGGDTEADEFDDESEVESSEREVAPPTPKRGRGRPAKKVQSPAVTKKSNAKTKAAVEPVAKAKAKMKTSSEEPEDEEDSDDYNENRITFIPAVQLRDTGGVDYEDARLHKNTLLFLKDLKANNERGWLKENDKEYRRSLKDWESFVETLTEKIIEADETIPELPLRDVIFRIYRDIRFSKDRTPYKPHFSAAWSRTGRKGNYACYYVHLEPGRCMVGGGLWHPDNHALANLRASIDERPHRIRRVLMNPTFRKTFLPNAKADNERSVLAAFAASNKENALKTKPKGFHPEHRDIELLKLRNYTIGKRFDDSELIAEDAQDKVMDVIKAMVEFVTYLNSVVMPDPNLDSDSDDAEAGAEEQEDGSDGD